jgi:hypothetical protein
MQVYFETLQVDRGRVVVWLRHPHRMLICSMDYLTKRQKEAIEHNASEQKSFIVHCRSPYDKGHVREYKTLDSPMDSKMPILIECHPNESLTTQSQSFFGDYFVLSHDEWHRIVNTTRSILNL